MKKRILSILISIVMVISLIPPSYFADEINAINDIGITNNEENNKQEKEKIKKSNNDTKKENISTSTGNIDKKEENEINSKENSEMTKENEDITKNNDVSNQVNIQAQTNLQINNQNVTTEVNSSYDDFNHLEKEKWLKYLEENGIMEGTNVISQDTILDENGKQKLYFNDEDSNDISVTTSPMVAFRSIPKKKFEVKKRYTVLLLDVSPSMDGTPGMVSTPKLNMKKAAIKFCDSVLKDKSKNYIAIVPYGYDVYPTYGTTFTNNKKDLENSISNLPSISGTGTDRALKYADNLLASLKNENGLVKNIILLSDGMPNEGERTKNGKYKYTDHYYHEYANTCYNTAEALKNKRYRLYTLGFFHSLEGKELTFARQFMNDLQNAGYYDVTDPDKIEFVFGEIASEITEVIGKFKYPGTVDGRDYEETYFYKDSYFKDSSYNFNQSLATMSLCLELSSWASSSESEYGNKSVNARNLFSEIGFSEFRQNDRYYSKPTMDSIGVVAANKKITVNGKEYTLIALAVRGGGYESEWASNFTIGKEGYHQGFKEARDNVIGFLQWYIADRNLKGDIKLWITGYSRAGATTNLVAGAINEGEVNLSPCKLERENMYAYTFEAPMGTVEKSTNNKIHYNIHNIVNLDDAVPYVAPSYWNFRRYGYDRMLPHKSFSDPKYHSKFKKMKQRLDEYSNFSSSQYKIDKFRMKKIDISFENGIRITDDPDIPQNRYLYDYINLFASLIDTRYNYVRNYQEGIRHFMWLVFHSDSQKSEKFLKIFSEKMKKENWLYRYFLANIGTSPSKNEQLTYEYVEKLMIESLNEAGITDYNRNIVHEYCYSICDLLVAFAANHPILTYTFFENNESIAQAHYPEICLAWMQSMDDNYETGATPLFTYGKNRLIRINCPVDIYVYENGDLVGQIIDNKVQKIHEYAPPFGINQDGEKVAYLTAECDCSVKIVATGDGTVNYSIQEESAYKGTAKIINYFDIPIKKGMVLTANLPEYSKDELEDADCNPSSRNYNLKNETENIDIQPTNELLGQDAKNSTCYIDVKVDEEQRYGLAWGSGSRVLGGYAMLTAYPSEGYHLEGWYEDGKKVSTELEYRVRADKDRTFIAKFAKDKNDKDNNNNKQSNKDKNTDSNISNGNKSNKDKAINTDKKSSDKNQNTDKYQDYFKDNNDRYKNPIKIGSSDMESNKTHGKKLPFTDIYNNPAKDGIEYLWSNGILSGYSDNTFKPNNPITRAEVVKVILKAKDLKPSKYKNIFTDVRSTDWFADYLQTAKDNKLIQGYPDRSFHPDEYITIAQWAVILDALIKDEVIDNVEVEQILSHFEDKDSIPNWSKISIARLIKSGILSGEKQVINADKPISRAEVADTLYKILYTQQLRK